MQFVQIVHSAPEGIDSALEYKNPGPNFEALPDLAQINIANDQEPYSLFLRTGMLFQISDLLGFEVTPLNGSVVCNTQAGLLSAFNRFKEGLTERNYPRLFCSEADLDFVRSGLLPSDLVLAPIEHGDISRATAFVKEEMGQAFYFLKITSEEDIPGPEFSDKLGNPNIWLHVELDNFFPYKNLSSQGSSNLKAIVSKASISLRSFCVDCYPLSKAHDIAAILFPNDPNSKIFKEDGKEIAIQLEAEDEFEGNEVDDSHYFVSRSIGQLDTTISSVPLVLAVGTLSAIEDEIEYDKKIVQYGSPENIPKKRTEPYFEKKDLGDGRYEIIASPRGGSLMDDMIVGFPHPNEALDLCNMAGIFQPDGFDKLAHYLFRDLNSNEMDMQTLNTKAREVIQNSLLGFGGLDLGGWILESGSAANFRALQCSQIKRMLQGDTNRSPKVLASVLSHRSLKQSAGQHYLEVYPRGEDFQIQTEDYLDKLRLNPSFMSVTLGTTYLGHVEFIADQVIEEILKRDVWLHVDCCYGLNLLLRPDADPYVERAKEFLAKLISSGAIKSLSCDPHKVCSSYGIASLFLFDKDHREILSHTQPVKKNAFPAAAMLHTLNTASLAYIREAVADTHQAAKNFAEFITQETPLRLVAPVRAGVVALAARSNEEAAALHQNLLDSAVSVSKLCLPTLQGDIYGIRVVFSNSYDWQDGLIPDLVGTIRDTVG